MSVSLLSCYEVRMQHKCQILYVHTRFIASELLQAMLGWQLFQHLWQCQMLYRAKVWDLMIRQDVCTRCIADWMFLSSLCLVALSYTWRYIFQRVCKELWIFIPGSLRPLRFSRRPRCQSKNRDSRRTDTVLNAMCFYLFTDVQYLRQVSRASCYLCGNIRYLLTPQR